MKIIIDIEGDNVTALGLPAPLGGAVAPSGDPPPNPIAPAALLERAKKLGALSAGVAQLGTGAALFATAMPGETLQRVEAAEPAEAKPRKKKRARRRAAR